MPRTATLANDPTHYALIDDVVEVEDHGGFRRQYVILDCITREAAHRLKDRTWANMPSDSEGLNDSMVVRADLPSFQRALPNFQAEVQWISFRLDDVKPSSPAREGLVLASFVSLSGSADEEDTPPFFLSGLRSISSPPMKQLALLVGLNSRKQEIAEVLDGQRQSHWTNELNIVVYDIGQGSATALVDIHGRPLIYFDLGWPTGINRGTRPTDPPDLFAPDGCIRCRWWSDLPAPVILSHWDFDHWAYAVQNDNYVFGKKAAKMTFRPEALARPWIVPKPPRIKNTRGLGPTHMRLLAALPQRFLWPNSLQSVTFFAGTLTRTDPKVAASDRNNQGLAWFVKHPAAPDAILLPGDVSFNRLRRPKLPVQVTSLVASHHGGQVDGMSTHLPTASTGSRLVISVGDGNKHDHPNSDILAAYGAAGWTQDIRTSNRTVAWSSEKKSGSILMQLHLTGLPPHFCCHCLHDGNLVPTQLS